jgi:hypothetical protein
MINTINDAVYIFFTNQICKAEYEIRENSRKINTLSKTQTELKRGKTYLVKIRREYVDGKKIKTKKKNLENS